MTDTEIILALRRFREQVEAQADGVSIAEITCTLATALSDVCDALALTPVQRREVLGPHADDLLGGHGWGVIEGEVLAPTPLTIPVPQLSGHEHSSFGGVR